MAQAMQKGVVSFLIYPFTTPSLSYPMRALRGPYLFLIRLTIYLGDYVDVRVFLL